MVQFVEWIQTGFPLIAKGRNELRNRFSIKESDILFLYLGRLTYDKGLVDLARAFKKVADINRETKSCYCGTR